MSSSVTLSSSMLGRSAALRGDKMATPPKPVTVAAATQKPAPLDQLQSAQSVRAESRIQAQDKSQLSYQKTNSTLSVQVINKQTGAFIRQIEFKGFQAFAYSSHGYKGNYVDQSA